MTDEVWFKLAIADFHDKNKPYVGKVTIGCFGELTPVTCLNFVSLTKGYRKGRVSRCNKFFFSYFVKNLFVLFILVMNQSVKSVYCVINCEILMLPLSSAVHRMPGSYLFDHARKP